MKIVAVIPARYESSRFPGKPLADICGKPMIWWVYNQVKKVKELDEIYVATDDERIKKVCEDYKMKVIMTSKGHPNHISRVYEFSTLVKGDFYLCINGDEPMLESKTIQAILRPIKLRENFYALNLMTKISDATEVVDFSKIKIITDSEGYGIYMSRSPIPYPRGNSKFEYKKYVGVECMTKEALSFYVNTDVGFLEKTEDIDHLRFIEHGKKIKFIEVNSDTLSVDTPKDLEKVVYLLKKKKR